MFETITEKQFQKAAEICAEARHLISLRDNLIEKGELDASLVLHSIMWKAVRLTATPPIASNRSFPASWYSTLYECT